MPKSLSNRMVFFLHREYLLFFFSGRVWKKVFQAKATLELEPSRQQVVNETEQQQVVNETEHGCG